MTLNWSIGQGNKTQFILWITKWAYVLNLVQNGIFWSKITKSGVYLCYRYCSKLFRKLRKRVNFGNGVAEIQQKYERESEREKILNFGNHITEIPVAQTC